MALNQGCALRFLFFVFLLVCVRQCSAVVYNVGGATDWTFPDEGANYNSWSESNTFRVNDILQFTYSPAHDVQQVSAADYEACVSSRPLASYTNGDTKVQLQRPGTYYFICGVAGHCASGMKVQVTVNGQ